MLIKVRKGFFQISPLPLVLVKNGQKMVHIFGPPYFVFLIWDRNFRQNGPFVALAVPVVLAASEAFFDFLFLSYGRFRERTRPTQQKVLPHPTMGHRLTVTALALSARGLDKIRLRL